MEKVFNSIEQLAATARDYTETKIESAKLAFAEKTALIAANIIGGLVVLLAFTLFIVMLAVGAALLIGEWIGHTWAGFLVVAGICLLKAVVIWAAKKRIIQLPVMNALLKQLFDDEED